MRFYTQQHKHYCGIDLHARTMYLCVLDLAGEVLLDQNIRCEPRIFLRTIAPYREDLVVAVECIFTWYWLADLCTREQIPFGYGIRDVAKYDKLCQPRLRHALPAPPRCAPPPPIT